MLSFGALSFLMPIALGGLLAIPVIWWLVRLTPPLPQTIRFPAIAILARLRDVQADASALPWWLMFLRMAIIALLIVGAAEPVMNPRDTIGANGPLIVVVDDGWASAPHWDDMIATARDYVIQAGRQKRSVLIVKTAPQSEPATPELVSANKALQNLDRLKPSPWSVDRSQVLSVLDDPTLALSTAGQVIWLSDGLADGHDTPDGQMVLALQKLGPLIVVEPTQGTQAMAVLPPISEGNELLVPVIRADPSTGDGITLIAYNETGHAVSRENVWFKEGDTRIEASFDLPSEARNKLERIEIENLTSTRRTAAGVVLLDERWRRRPVGLIAGQTQNEAQRYLSDFYYLGRALEPLGEIRRGSVAALLERETAVMVIADSSSINAEDTIRLKQWMNDGGVLIVFAGPRLAEASNGEEGESVSQEISPGDISSLLPVKLRTGDRIMGGTMSWRRPAGIDDFRKGTPFYGLSIPSDVVVTRQVLAQPDFELENKVWAQLIDGTPLVTAKPIGQGWSVLFHVTANAEWSTLPLSGLFVEMLQTTVKFSRGIRGVGGQDPESVLNPLKSLDGFGVLGDASSSALSFARGEFSLEQVSHDHPPGFYGTDQIRRALNLGASIEFLKLIDPLPETVSRETYHRSREFDLTAWFFGAAFLLFVVDILASLWLRGFRPVFWKAAYIATMAALMVFGSAQVQAQQSDAELIRSANLNQLGYVLSGHGASDETVRLGLKGLGTILSRRTAVELDSPVGINPEIDELVFYPMIYWQVNADTPIPSLKAAKRINEYIDNGGTVLFDASDGGRSTNGGAGGLGVLRRFARVLDIPHLIPVAGDHVLTRAFYLLSEFPGRWTGGKLWVVPAEERINDGVSPIIAGTHGWAEAWAIDDMGEPLYAVIPGGDRQREMAYRFGVNLVMYVLTGNYKGDQVHLQIIVDRLGQ